MNFVKKTAILAISLLVGSQMIHGMDGVGGHDAPPPPGDVKKGVAAQSWLKTAKGFAHSGLDAVTSHPWISGSVAAVLGSAALIKFNETVRNKVKAGYESAKAKMSEGYKAVRSRVQPALDTTITFGHVVAVGLAAGVGILAKYTGPNIWGDNGAYDSAKKYLSESRVAGWFAKDNDNRMRNIAIAAVGTAAAATATVFGVKAIKARRAKAAATSSTSSSSSTTVEDADEEDEE